VTTTDPQLLAPVSADGADAGDVEAAPEPRVPGLSPSRANDFQQCPLLFRFRVVDRLPEPPSLAAARGTLVHTVLERLLENLSFEAADRNGAAVTIDADYVDKHLGELVKDEDLTRYIL